jgi:hypothetical protein
MKCGMCPSLGVRLECSMEYDFSERNLAAP